MTNKVYSFLVALIGVVLITSMFPSWTALSSAVATKWPELGRYIGPINPLKVMSPLIGGFLCLSFYLKRDWSRNVLVAIGITAILLISGTFLGARACGFPPAVLREAAVILLAFLGVLALLRLPEAWRRRVILGWAGVLLSGVILNYLAPAWLTWINTHIFDPLRVVEKDRGHPFFLIAYYDVASLGKLLVWLPWLVIWADPRLGVRFSERKGNWYYLILLLLLGFLSIATSQRGPIIGYLVGILVFILHQSLVLRDLKLLKWGGALVLLGLVSAPMVIPRSIYENRIRPFFISTEAEKVASASRSVNHRMALFELNVDTVLNNPLGYPCRPFEDYQAKGLDQTYHAHNLYLEQFVSKGWLWGLWHIFLWVGAWILTWRNRNMHGSILLGGLTTIMVMGMADHPWFVINHALILWTFIGLGFLGRKKLCA